MSKGKRVLKVLSSLPPSVFSNLFPSFCIRVIDSSLDELASDSRRHDGVVVYVRHSPTLELLKKWLHDFKVGDTAEVGEEVFYVVSAPQRTPASGQNIAVNEKNIVVLRCVAAKGVWL